MVVLSYISLNPFKAPFDVCRGPLVGPGLQLRTIELNIDLNIAQTLWIKYIYVSLWCTDIIFRLMVLLG